MAPTIVDKGDFDAEALSQKLKEATKGLGTDESELVQALTGYSNKQIQELRRVYKTQFGEELREIIESETSGNFGVSCLALVDDRVEYRARLLHESLAGAGTAIKKLVDVIAPMEADQIEAVKAAYKRVYGKDLEEDVRGDTSGNNEKTLVALLAAGRPASGDVDQQLAVEEAQKLYEGGEGRLGTDSTQFRTVFCTRSWAQLGATLKAYNRQKDGHDIETAIKGEFTSNTETLYLAMARHALDPAGYFANILKKCVEGLGTSDERLIYTLVLQSEANLGDVKRSYMTLFGETLAADVAGDTSGNYEKVLLGLINGNA